MFNPVSALVGPTGTPLLDSLYESPAPVPHGLSIGLVHGGQWDSWFGVSITNLLNSLIHKLIDVPINEVICVRSGPALSLGRGVLTNKFMESTISEGLLLLDSDMWFTPGDIANMWYVFSQGTADGQQIDMLGGLAFISSAMTFGVPGTIQPNLWTRHPTIPDQRLVGWDYPPNTLCQVAATGAACLLVRRNVFADIGVHHWHHMKMFNYVLLAEKFASCTDPGEIEAILRKESMEADECGEDLSFFLRAAHYGYKCYVHTGIKFGHSKAILLTEDDYLKSIAPPVSAAVEDTQPEGDTI